MLVNRVYLKHCLTSSPSEFPFFSQYKSTSMEEKIQRKQVSSSTMIYIHHKDHTRRVFWYILYIILCCRDHFSDRKAVHIVSYSHLDITFGSEWKSPKLLYGLRNYSNAYVKGCCFTLVLFLFQKALQYHAFFPLKEWNQFTSKCAPLAILCFCQY